MSFDDLPLGWEHEPITTDLLPDVLDLFCRTEYRQTGALFFLLLDPDLRIRQPAVVDSPDSVPHEEKAKIARNVAFATVANDLGGLAMGVCRRGAARVTADDLDWAQALDTACHEHGIVNLGCCLASLYHGVEAVVPVPVPDQGTAVA